MKFLYFLDDRISRLEQILIAALLAMMIILAFSQIVLRNFFATGIAWGDSLVRYLVVWVGFVGAAIAAKEGKHITIDVLSRWITGAGGSAIQAVSHFCSTAICGLLTWAGIKFIWFEAQMGGTAFFKLPIWVPELIIPAAFGLMTLRYALRLINEFIRTTTRSNRTAYEKNK
jgi:TRAP-type C4-dicarboxylate transport system permease small subunit